MMKRALAAAAGLLCWSVLAQDPVDPATVEWRDLFNGKDVECWQDANGGPAPDGWVIEEGVLVRKKKTGYIWSKERFGDFILDFEFNTDGNSGLFFRTDNVKSCVQTGFEMQINKANTTGKHGVGAIYDCVAPSKNTAKEGWNHAVLTCIGPKVQVEMNGETIVDMDLDKWDTAQQNPDGTKNKFRRALKDYKRDGHIGFQEHGAVVRLRNIKIKVLDKPAEK